ncbi:hypothetical protein [Salipiger mangrovisoli]|uniref:Phage abortive infection protein n=1 Tax=Salipiger mangrovisoli TaxID=2865933 RepID=A0ABR9X2S9_9RHOB|nr:hypothetical protein [Salipiger mangrovisoli]MBE9637829.1 hypothetical protein [Salipiger mangrovisoli]
MRQPPYQGAAAVGVLLGVAGLAFCATAPWPEAMRVIGLLLSAAVTGCGAYLALAGARGLVFAKMVLLVLLPLAGIALLLIVAVVQFLPQAGAGAEKITPAIIAGIAVSLGWIAGPLAQELRRNDEREERRRDMIEASANEIWLIAKFASNLDCKAAIQEISEAFEKDESYEVFVFFRRDYGTLKRLIEQIEILQKQQIGPMLGLYQRLNQLDQMEENMASDRFRLLSRVRREKAVKVYYRVLDGIPEEAVVALHALDRGEYASKVAALREERLARFAAARAAKAEQSAKLASEGDAGAVDGSPSDD